MTKSFEEYLLQYAKLAVQVGVNLRAGQRLVVLAPIEAAPFARLVAAEAYKAGARFVDMLWNDDQVTLARYQYAPRDSFEEFPAYRAQALIDYVNHADAILNIFAEDPDLLKGQDPKLIQTARRVAMQHQLPYLQAVSRNATNWCIVSVPIPSWASKVFPGMETEQSIAKLWDAIFNVTRIKENDPISVWKEHVANLHRRSDALTRKQLRGLHYTGPGTDLTLGLPKGHRWLSGQLTAANGIPFTANMPTEEVFTLPHKDHADGTITATRPLSYAGALIEGFSLTFEKGRVVNFHADKGEEYLRNLVETDEGSRHLGEVALVPHRSPISQSGIMFFNTLFDENAASHLALGRALQFNLENGPELSEEAFAAAGGNQSLQHVDFMVGSGEIDIDGICEDGTREPVMRKGEWAFEV